MHDEPLTIRLDLTHSRRLYIALISANVLLTCTTALFIALWAHMDELGLWTRRAVAYLLVQGHLATENVVAAWYSSMLLLGVAVLAFVAFSADGRRGRSSLRYGWLCLAAAFVVLSFDEIGSIHERFSLMPLLSQTTLYETNWTVALAVPILGVAVFLLAFAWAHVRRVTHAAWLIAAGVACYLLNPVFETAELALLRAGGTATGTWQRHVHDVLLVLEEGGLELFGTLLFIVALVTYLRRTGAERLQWTWRPRHFRMAVWSAAIALMIGAYFAPIVVANLPKNDNGLPQNWFPAASWLLVAIIGWQVTPRLTWGALGLSAVFGAGLWGYVGALQSSAAWQWTPMVGVVTAGLALELLVFYRLMRSAMSSIASPTLRRPRPNPS